jgi:hypothetical protein
LNGLNRSGGSNPPLSAILRPVGLRMARPSHGNVSFVSAFVSSEAKDALRSFSVGGRNASFADGIFLCPVELSIAQPSKISPGDFVKTMQISGSGG